MPILNTAALPRRRPKHPFTQNGGGATGVLFQSDWGTATGQSDAAQRDTNQSRPWTSINNNSQYLSVVAATGLDFPTTNVLRVERPAGGTPSCWCHLSYSAVAPAVNEQRYYRTYVRVAYSNTTDTDHTNHHPVQNQASPNTYNFRIGNNLDGSFNFRFVWDPDTTHWFISNTSADNILQKNTTYRFEWKIDRISSAQCDITIRLYNSSNTLLYPDGSGNTLVTQDGHLSAITAVHHTMSAADAAAMSEHEQGSNGGTAMAVQEFHYFGAVMIRSDDWCGAY